MLAEFSLDNVSMRARWRPNGNGVSRWDAVRLANTGEFVIDTTSEGTAEVAVDGDELKRALSARMLPPALLGAEYNDLLLIRLAEQTAEQNAAPLAPFAVTRFDMDKVTTAANAAVNVDGVPLLLHIAAQTNRPVAAVAMLAATQRYTEAIINTFPAIQYRLPIGMEMPVDPNDPVAFRGHAALVLPASSVQLNKVVDYLIANTKPGASVIGTLAALIRQARDIARTLSVNETKSS